MVPYRLPGTRSTRRRARRMDQTNSELPAYSPTHSPTVPPREPVVHKYSLQNKSGKPWFTLEVSSKAPSPEKIPLIIEGEPVTGLVSLDLDSETRMKSVVVSVRISGRLLLEYILKGDDIGPRRTYHRGREAIYVRGTDNYSLVPRRCQRERRGSYQQEREASGSTPLAVHPKPSLGSRAGQQ